MHHREEKWSIYEDYAIIFQLLYIMERQLILQYLYRLCLIVNKFQRHAHFHIVAISRKYWIDRLEKKIIIIYRLKSISLYIAGKLLVCDIVIIYSYIYINLQQFFHLFHVDRHGEPKGSDFAVCWFLGFDLHMHFFHVSSRPLLSTLPV